MYLVLRDQSI